MNKVSADSIDYGILCDRKAKIESCSDFIHVVLPRNCIPFKGTGISVTHMRSIRRTGSVKNLLIPDSVHSIYGFDSGPDSKLEYLIFESGSELGSIPDAAFAPSQLVSLSFSATVRFMGEKAFADCRIGPDLCN
jgi:hypothetical protein